MQQRSDKLLQNCTVQLQTSSAFGTGFFVAPGLILTCAHVVQQAIKDNNVVKTFWGYKNAVCASKVLRVIEDPFIDLALLEVEKDAGNHFQPHPCVLLESAKPMLDEDLYSFGYTRNNPNGDSVTFKYEGESFQKHKPLLKLKQGQVEYGRSGSPLLILRTGKVCGVLSISRSITSDLGGRAVPIFSVATNWPDLMEKNQQFHVQHANQTKTNPFVYGTPVPSRLFIGRRRAIADVKNRIGAITAQNINIVGHRRSGKSSLIRYIKESPDKIFQPEHNPIIISLDLQDKKFHTPQGIIEGLRRGITKTLSKEPWQRSDNEDPYEVDDALMEIKELGYRLIVMLDEFEEIVSHLEKFQYWGEDWRSKATAGLLTLVIASKRPLSEVYSNIGLTSPFSNIFSTTVIGAFEVDEWQKLITDSFKSLTFDQNLLDWVDTLTGGLPFYVQMLGALLWQIRDINEAETDFVFQARPRFQELWDNLSVSERALIQSNLGFSSEVISFQSSIKDDLKRHGILKDDGNLFSRAFTDFVKYKK